MDLHAFVRGDITQDTIREEWEARTGNLVGLIPSNDENRQDEIDANARRIVDRCGIPDELLGDMLLAVAYLSAWVTAGPELDAGLAIAANREYDRGGSHAFAGLILHYLSTAIGFGGSEDCTMRDVFAREIASAAGYILDECLNRAEEMQAADAEAEEEGRIRRRGSFRIVGPDNG